MYSDQTVLPPQLPGSSSRFTLPPIGSSASFSASLPRLPYGSDQREQPATPDKTGRWQLPPLVGLVPQPSTSSSTYHHQQEHHHHHQNQNQNQNQRQHHQQPPRPPPPHSSPSASTQVKSTHSFVSTSSQTTYRTEDKSSIWRSALAQPPIAQPPIAQPPIAQPPIAESPAAVSKPAIPTISVFERQTALASTSSPAVPEDPYYYTPYTDERPAIYSERIQEIDQEFSENRETIYLEKLKKLQEELSAIQHGGHEVFDDNVADMEKERAKESKNASFLMDYRIQHADKVYKNELWIVENETEAERRDLKKAMLFIIEEKRKRIKECRDEDALLSNDFVLSTPQGWNRRRTRGATNGVATELTLEQLLMNRNGTKNNTTKRRNNDRSRDAANINYALNIRNEAELDADFNAMRQDASPSVPIGLDHDDDDDGDYLPEISEHLPKRARTSHYYDGHGSSPYSRSSRR